jgi:tetratricopeptide (TPR) repeat protein
MKSVITVAILLCSAALAGAQGRLADDLRKGVVLEEADQNLEKAIQVYQGILARFDEDRKAAATALFRLAECYRKTGKRDQAVQAYGRIVREFPDHAALVRSSREHLASLGVPGRPGTPATTRAREVLAQTAPEVTPEPGPAFGGNVKAAEADLQELQQRLADYQKRIDAGGLSRDSVEYRALQREHDDARRRLETVRLYEQQAREERALNRQLTQRIIESVEQEISYIQQRIIAIEEKIKIGSASSDNAELLQLRRDQLALQRRLYELQSTMKR